MSIFCLFDTHLSFLDLVHCETNSRPHLIVELSSLLGEPGIRKEKKLESRSREEYWNVTLRQSKGNEE